MPSTCIFKFDRENPIYFNGETVRACVTLTTTTEKTCREVYMEFKGEAKVRWTERRNKSSEKFRGDETYISNHTTLHPDGRLPPGTYIYNFEIILPIEAPSSCVAEFGDIKYEIALVIDRPYHTDNVFRAPISVVRNLNLNLYPELLIPLQGEDIKYLCCWLCKSGPIISKLTIPFGGYTPGQYIKYTLHIDNQSNGYDLIGIHLRLVQTCSYIATRPRSKTRVERAEIAEINQDETILRLSKRVFEGILCIPSVSPSSDTQSIIVVNYNLEMAIKTGKCHKNSNIIIPIKIGTVPLYQSVDNSEQISYRQPSESTINTPIGQQPSNINPSAPFSYEQSTSVSNQLVGSDTAARHQADGFLTQYQPCTDSQLSKPLI